MTLRLSFTFLGGMLVMLALAGCASPRGGKAESTLPAISTGQARVVFLRQGSVFQAGQPVELQINGATVAKLRNRDYTYFDLPPGNHHLVVTVFPHTGSFRTGLTLKDTETRFLLIRPDTRIDDRRPLFRESRRFDLDGGQFDVQEIGTASGEEHRRVMHYSPPLSKVPAPRES